MNFGRGQAAAGYLAAALGTATTVAALVALRASLNVTTVALLLLLIVLFIATLFGSRPGLVASLLAALCYNFFFLPPYYTLTIADPQNWTALGAFLLTALTAGWLSSSARRRADEAEQGRREIKRLYEELRASFRLASEAEALRQSEQLKSALLDAVTHDVRTPLTAIKASVTTLLGERRAAIVDEPPVVLDDETRSEMLQVIDEETDRLNRFTEGLIELARVEAGEMRLRRRWGTLDEIVATTLDRAAPLLREHKVEIELERELPALRLDARAVSEVIYTLLDNAAKYSPAGRRVRVSASRGEGETVAVSIEDEGAGVPVKLRERVFDKFFRATRDGDIGGAHPPGTGLGLAIAKGIVEAHGGRIFVEDAPGGGARFVFTLPVGDEEENAVVATVNEEFPSL